MHEMAITVLVAGHGGGKVTRLVLLIVVVSLIMGWAVHAVRVRGGQGRKQ